MSESVELFLRLLALNGRRVTFHNVGDPYAPWNKSVYYVECSSNLTSAGVRGVLVPANVEFDVEAVLTETLVLWRKLDDSEAAMWARIEEANAKQTDTESCDADIPF